MPAEMKTTITFTPEQILEAARWNVLRLSLAAAAFAKANALSPAEFWAFMGHQIAAGMARRQPAAELAQGAALNMVSAGCELHSLSGDESEATAALGGWPPEQRYGLTQEEADTIWGVFGPVAEQQGFSYAWQRQGDEVTMTFLRRSNA